MDRIQQLVLEHRRLLAAVLAGLAVLTGLSSLRQPTDGIPVVVSRHDLRSGHVITERDLRTTTVPAAAAAGHALDRSAAVGRRVAGPMRRGETVTDFRVLRADALAGYGTGAVLTTIRVDLADGAAGVRVGDRVDVVAVDPDGESRATVVARAVEVVTVPGPDDPDATSLGIVTSEKDALSLATAGLEARFSLITSS
ncbi:MAG: flagellar biosynthesis protein FlgA [Aeromicrobium sp.]|jgi:Flp pilus assembly protein CpaB|uniref:SAF domain-containing protein n=1 Tax=Aeromicrobium sp. TaxID=1871063 RepID=UPI00260770DF|nr:SAF domain-containing protein [Aeromicrobium sp.]MCW2788892.1 flagellar biosynthesis protein FlgA [Aeromicrobium sp.]MCW2823721.1 flagellar biosynthesis protein FlgA [Aeromicrobium sp.]